MKRSYRIGAMQLVATLACALWLPAHAAAILNGGFEAGFANWTRADQLGSEGTFFLQTGTLSPVNALPVPAPPQGLTAAMTDAQGGGSHVLYQNFAVTAPVTPTTLNFSLFVGNRDAAFFTPATLDWATPTLNQQARVDILTATSDPFSVAVTDVLQNLYRTLPGDPLVSGYNTISVDVTALLNAHLNETLRLRFAEVDNVNIFNFGVDNVSFSSAPSATLPEPSSWILSLSAMFCLAVLRRRRTQIGH
jgi:hypothetical protein